MRTSYLQQIARPPAAHAPQLTPSRRWPLRAGEERPPAAPPLAEAVVPTATATISAAPPAKSDRPPPIPVAAPAHAPVQLPRFRARPPPLQSWRFRPKIHPPPRVQRKRASQPQVTLPMHAAVITKADSAEPQAPVSPIIAASAGDNPLIIAPSEQTITKFTAAAPAAVSVSAAQARSEPAGTASARAVTPALPSPLIAASAGDNPLLIAPPEQTITKFTAAAPAAVSVSAAQARSEPAGTASARAVRPALPAGEPLPQRPPPMRPAEPVNTTVRISSIEVRVAPPPAPPTPPAPPALAPVQALSRGFVTPFGLRQG